MENQMYLTPSQVEELREMEGERRRLMSRVREIKKQRDSKINQLINPLIKEDVHTVGERIAPRKFESKKYLYKYILYWSRLYDEDTKEYIPFERKIVVEYNGVAKDLDFDQIYELIIDGKLVNHPESLTDKTEKI